MSAQLDGATPSTQQTPIASGEAPVPAWRRTPVVPGAGQPPTTVIHPQRLLAVARSALIDTAADPHIDELVRLARDATGARSALFTVVDAHRSLWRSSVGLEPRTGAGSPVEHSLGQILVDTDAPLVVEDADHDGRTRRLGVVAELAIGACLCHPVHDQNGQVLGALCVLSDRPRTWSAADQRAVGTVAVAVGNAVALRVARAQVDLMRDARDGQAALARSLQNSLLPPQLPFIRGLDAAAAYLPAGDGSDVVGDFYDLFETDGRWWAVMGDVCGHGVEAATITALARYTLRTEAAHPGATPRTVLHRLHDALTAHHGHTRFVTAAVATLHPDADGATGLICSAGHEPPLIRRADGHIDIPPTRGRVLGLVDDVLLEETSYALGHGDALVLYTDGVTEARSGRGGELFGDDRLARVLSRRCGDLDAGAVLDQLLLAVDGHSRGYHPDDTAIVVVLA